MKLRDAIWGYPEIAIAIIRRFSLFFILLAGITVGTLTLLVLMGAVSAAQQRKLFTGELNYGVVGEIDVINALEVGPSDAEQVATKLLYNALVTIDESGNIYPELAETWGISPDGRTYTFFLRKGIRWHDGYELTSKDVATTFDLLKSGDTETVLGAIAKEVEIKIIGLYEVSFTLKQVNAAFLELMATPILPEHLYTNISYSRLVELGDSILPVGTGPYRYMRRIDNAIYFESNPTYFKGSPSIKKITLKVYDTYNLAEKALLGGEIHMLSPIDVTHLERLQKLEQVSSRLLVESFVQANNIRLLLFNAQSASPLAKDKSFRQAVAKAVDRATIAASVTGARIAYGPYDKSSYAYSPTVESLNGFATSESNGLLEKLGWTYAYSGAPYRSKGGEDLKITLTYLENETNKKVVTEIREQLKTVGINATLNGVTGDMMVQNVLPKKEFDLLLFEIHTGIDPDQYGLWHSSQTTFPGLNLGGYNSANIDSLLERGRLQTNRDKRLEIYYQFQQELVNDSIAIFLYHPAYYEVFFDIIDRKLPQTIVDPSDRLSSIHTWKLLPGWRNWQTR